MTTVEEFVLCARQLEVRADIASRFKRRSAMQAGLQHHGQFSPTDNNLRVCYDGLSVVWCQMRVSEQGQFGVLACCLGLFRQL